MSSSAPNKWLVAVAVALGALMEIIDTSIVNVALSEMQASLGATLTQMSWVVSSYAIANVIILPLSAWLGFRFGKKRYFVFSLVGFTLASVLCGLSTSLWMLTVSRVLQGLFGGGLLAKAQAILFETFPREEQAAAQGFFGAIVIAGPVVGPTLGGYIVTNVGWRWIFFINVPVGIAATAMCLSALPADGALARRAPIDWTSIALLAVGLGALQTFLEEGYSEDWFESTFITALAVASVLSLVLFVVRQLRSEHPVVDLRVLRYRSLWAGSVLSVIIGMVLYGAMFSVPIFASSVMRFTAQQIGLLMLPGALASALTMPIASMLVRRVDPRALLTTGALILTGAVMWLGTLTTSTGADDLLWPLLVRAFGTVFMFLPLSMAALGPIPKEEIAAATGFFSLTRQLGGSVGVALLSTFLGTRTAFHRSVLVEHLSVTDPAVQARVAAMTGSFASKGADVATAEHRALTLLDGAARLQSSVLAFNDTFYLTGLLVLLSIPLVFLLGKPKGGAKVEAGAH
ncbi:MAG: DHA2 family efflux MFS transporter permease subunit [Labilithrix sp.]|nr:DHA2 family efflux MFS transporter permease subunit [Labilithrix sp.]MCW5832372.1 DHA2 family efflux MFS transporter permease subunit [Labilithrix sp.]